MLHADADASLCLRSCLHHLANFEIRVPLCMRTCVHFFRNSRAPRASAEYYARSFPLPDVSTLTGAAPSMLLSMLPMSACIGSTTLPAVRSLSRSDDRGLSSFPARVFLHEVIEHTGDMVFDLLGIERGAFLIAVGHALMRLCCWHLIAVLGRGRVTSVSTTCGGRRPVLLCP